MSDWTTWTPIALSTFALIISTKAYGFSRRVHHDNQEQQRRLEDYEFYPRIHVNLKVGQENKLHAVVVNESASVLCRAGRLDVELSLATGSTHTHDREQLIIDRLDPDSDIDLMLAKTNSTIRNATPLIKQNFQGDFPGSIGHFWIRVMFEYESAIPNSATKHAFGRFFLQLQQDGSIVVVKRE